MKLTIDTFPDFVKASRLNLDTDYSELFSSVGQDFLISVTNARGIITYVNEAFSKISQYDSQELTGQNHRMLKSGKQSDVLFEDLWTTISSGKPWRGIIINRAKNGSFFKVDTHIVPIPGPRNRPEQYIALRLLLEETD